MFEWYEGTEKALLVHVFFQKQSTKKELNEFEVLVTSAQIEILSIFTTTRDSPDRKYFVGTGKAKELAEAVKSCGVSVILFNHILTPAQERNLESLCKCKVIDRTSLILDIFARRARSHEGKLQVELAQLRHLSTRLVRGWTHLERQKGGIGLRGPGETQLETDRRLLRARVRFILSRLGKVNKQRDQSRQSRDKADIPTLSLVGYTNAGKSTLFNMLTGAHVYAADQLFATLDPTLRRITIEDLGNAVIADTVGFIQGLPHELIAAFKATLKETQEADLLLHVIDASDPLQLDNISAVNQVLAEIEADTIPTLLIMNKIDKLSFSEPRIDRDNEGNPIRVWLSAETGFGIQLLFKALKELLARQMQHCQLSLPPNMTKLRSRFYEFNAVEEETINQDGSFDLQIRMPLIQWHKLCKQEQSLSELIKKNATH